jgi:3-isopropylmalate/(R)-2-methylmalate dehydratase large subunit
MAVEMGAKAGLIEPDEKTYKWLREHRAKGIAHRVKSDKDAVYSEVLEFDVNKIVPQVARPHTVDNVAPIHKLKSIKIDQAFLGTCTNGRLEDLRVAYSILKNNKINKDVKMIIAPASKDIFQKAMKKGMISGFVNAGASVVAPGCGPCVGTHNGVLSSGEVCISTANRNFKGRMGNPDAFIYLASPATVAASALEGKITDPRKYIM